MASAAGPGPAAPFGIWADALGDLAAGTGPPPADEPWTATLARIVPALAGQADRPGGRLAADPQLEHVRLCEAVVQFLIWASRPAPLLLAMEDLHAADTASLELIAYAGRRLARLPVLLVLTRRLEPGRRDLDAVLAALRSRRALATVIRLGPLTDDAARAVIRQTADVPEAVVSEIVQCAAGSPLLAVESARAAAEGGLVAGLAGAVRIAVGRLSGPARTFVEFAAVAGRAVDRAEVASLPLPSPALAATEALGSGLLQADGGRTGFRHALLADAVYQDIADPARARLHGALAQLLRTRARPARTGRRTAQAAEIARHLRAAGQDEQAVNYLVVAAQGARSVAAMAQADSFLTEALQIEPDDPDLLVELAEVSAFRGLPDRSGEAFGRALELIAPQDSGALISAWLRRGRWLRGGVCHPRESRRSYQNAACAAACAGEFGRALDFADRCLPLVVPNGLLRLSVYAQTARSAILRRLGRLPEACQACDAAAGYADRIGLPELDGLVHAERGLIAAAAAQPGEAVAGLTSALDLGAPVSRPATRLRLAEALVRAGQPDEAETELRAVTLEPVGPGDFPATLVAQMSRVQGLIAAARGDVALAERYLSESLASWQRIAGRPDSRQAGAGYVAGLIDLGRPPVSSLVETAPPSSRTSSASPCSGWPVSPPRRLDMHGVAGLRGDESVGQRVDPGQLGSQVGAEMMAGGERGGCVVADFRLPRVIPYQHLERQVQGRQRRGRHHRRARGRAAEQHQRGATQRQPRLLRLGALVDHREQLHALRGEQVRQARDGTGHWPRADLGNDAGLTPASLFGHRSLSFGSVARGPPHRCGQRLDPRTARP